ncbi:MAG: hypothetical protein M1822_008417 [Bathelium mastoideum]|nr:MAG: hypothetical protein M1822_008417 [Bathelium mastoideum]
MADTSPIAGALGSIIGYLGSEVAEKSLFERLLWPERFYNVASIRNIVEMAFLMPMGGPIHKAALRTLDKFRSKGLYEGAMQGHMLGTAFYADTRLAYTLHGYEGPDGDREIRNGLWATVLRHCRYLQRAQALPQANADTEAKGDAPRLVRRTTQVVRHLQLWQPLSEKEYEKVRIFCEDKAAVTTMLAVFASEISAIIVAVVVGWREQSYWFAAYFCLPLFFKMASVPLSVRRGPKHPSEAKFNPAEGDEDLPLKSTVVFEISDYDHGFPIIEGPEPVVRQFFKHWGHPLRENYRDRLREIGGMALVVAFVFYFPIGLLSMLWVSQPIQIIWLSYQLYTIVAMHIMRLRGSSGRGRTEEGLARDLVDGKVAALKSEHGGVIMAKLESTPVERISGGQAKVRDIVQQHAEAIKLKRRTTQDSDDTAYEGEVETVDEKMEKI